MTTNVVSIASFTGLRTTRYAAMSSDPGVTVVPFASPEGEALKLLARWIAARAASVANGETFRAAERREVEALKRFNVAKRASSHPVLVDKLLHVYWEASEARQSLAFGPRPVCMAGIAVALDEALKALPEAIGKRLVADLTPAQASRIGRTASALRRRRPRVQVAA